MDFCVVGYGSMGKRHARNLYSICEEKHIDCNIDLLRTQLRSCPQGIRQVYTNIGDLPDSYDAIFITNPTSLHYQTLINLREKSNSFFIEKPVFDNVEVDLQPFFSAANKTFYVACPMRYKPSIVWLKNNFDFSKTYALRAISSSYLPEWRPGVDYRNTYSAHSDLGGGVSIDLIHEWDYLQYLIGFPKRVESIISKKSFLEIDSDDIALYIAEYENMTVEIHLDYFGRVPMRKLEIFTQDDTMECDLLTDTIRFLKSGQSFNLQEERDETQKRELLEFFAVMGNKHENPNDIPKAIKTLQLAKGLL